MTRFTIIWTVALIAFDTKPKQNYYFSLFLRVAELKSNIALINMATQEGVVVVVKTYSDILTSLSNSIDIANNHYAVRLDFQNLFRWIFYDTSFK